MTIAGLGDSLTYGWMVERGFFDRFVDGLEQAYPRATIRRINAGVPGSTAREGLARVGDLVRQRPDLGIVQFGLNDCYGGVDAAEFERQLTAIASRMTAGGILTVLVTSCPVVDPEFHESVERFYLGIHRVAEALGLPLAELDRHWLGESRRLTRPHSWYQWDGVHPTDPGHACMARGLLELFGPPQAA